MASNGLTRKLQNIRRKHHRKEAAEMAKTIKQWLKRHGFDAYDPRLLCFYKKGVGIGIGVMSDDIGIPEQKAATAFQKFYEGNTVFVTSHRKLKYQLHHSHLLEISSSVKSVAPAIEG